MATTNHLLQRGVQRHLAGDFLAAKAAYDQLLQKSPHHPDGLHLLGLCEFQMGNPQLALPLISQAIEVSPQNAPFHSNLGSVLMALGRMEDAVAAYQTSVKIDPNHLDGWKNLGNLASRLNDHELAAQAFSAVARISNGKDGQALGYLGLSLAVLCRWDDVELTAQTLLAQNLTTPIPIPPFSALIHDFTPPQQRQIADNAAHAIHNEALKVTKGQIFTVKPRPDVRPERLKIGFLSDDFQAHAVGYLAIGLLEAIDHDRFEVFIYSYGASDDSAIRQRFAAAADHFVDIGPLNYLASAGRIHQDGIDILIDLKGHTGIPRAQILALRPASVQVAWLGFPGTFGGGDCDYIIADPFVIPVEEEAHYSEKVIRLPHCYQANDPKRPRAKTAPARAKLGLPKDAFVFGALNNTFKITAPVFQVWMKLLADCPDAVLWLLDHHPKTTLALQNAAQAAGVDPARLIFAPRVDQDDHLKRLSACDIALDTYPYGGHTTTSDFLWAGVPVIALVGRTFASRVAGSLLTAIGLPELIATDLQAYARLAQSFYQDRKALKALKSRLASARTTSQLFNTELFARDFEQLLDQIAVQGKTP